MGQQKDRPAFLFIGGAVGSGNTLLFESLIRDSDIYGINEDRLAGTLEALLKSEREMGACPHSVKAFVDFMYALRGDRKTLVLKTPANIRRIELLKTYLPGSAFIVTVRHPKSAIASGKSRHKKNVDEVAAIWKSDYEPILSFLEDLYIVTYEELVSQPIKVTNIISENILPLENNVFNFVRKITDPDRANDQWWRKNISAEEQIKIEKIVEDLKLVDLYEQISGNIMLNKTHTRTIQSSFKRRIQNFERVFIISSNKMRVFGHRLYNRIK